MKLSTKVYLSTAETQTLVQLATGHTEGGTQICAYVQKLVQEAFERGKLVGELKKELTPM